MQKNLRKTLFGFLFLLFVSGCVTPSDTTSEGTIGEVSIQKNKIFVLQQEIFSNSLTLTGTLEAARETMIATKVGGRIRTLHAEVGDRVNKGEILATLSGDESEQNLQTATVNQLNIKNTYNAQKDLQDERVRSAEKSLELVEANRDAIEISGESTDVTTTEQILLAEKGVEQAETAHENAQIIADQRLKTVYSNAKSTIRNALIASHNAIDHADSILGTTSSTSRNNDSYEVYLGFHDPGSKEVAITSLKQAMALKDEMQLIYDEFIENGNPTNEKYEEYLAQALTLLEATQEMGKDLQTMLNASTSGSELSADELLGFKNLVLMNGQNVESAILSSSGEVKFGVKGLLLTLDEIEVQNRTEISTAEKALLQAEQFLNQVKAASNQNVSDINSQIIIAEKQIEQARVNLETAKAERESILGELQTQIDLVKGNRALSEIAVENTETSAPFTGIITQKLGEVGQVISAGQPIFQISDTSGFTIKTQVPDTEIADISVGLKANIKLDGIQGSFPAEISKIDPNVDLTTRKLGIELALTDAPSNAKIGMFGRITIEFPGHESFFVPKDFIFSSYDGPYILLSSGEKQLIERGIQKGDVVKIWFDGIKEGIEITK